MNDPGRPYPQRTDTSGLRLYTHNIWGRSGEWNQRRQVLRDSIRELRPDLLTLQETIVTEEYDQVSDLLGENGEPYHIVHSRERESNGSGISIASRWPIAQVRELDLNITPRTGDFACTTLIAEIEAPSPFGTLLLANHFPDYQVDHEHERELQTLLAARAIEERIADRPMHVLLAGDLDAEPDAASLRFLSGKQSLVGLSACYQNAWKSQHPGEHGATYTARNPLAPNAWPFEQIDHIFIRCGKNGMPTLQIAQCEIIFDEPIVGVWASDHFGVAADFTAG